MKPCKLCSVLNTPKKNATLCEKCYEKGRGLSKCPLCLKRVTMYDNFDTWKYYLRIWCSCGLEFNYSKLGNFYYMREDQKEKFRINARRRFVKHWNNQRGKNGNDRH